MSERDEREQMIEKVIAWSAKYGRHRLDAYTSSIVADFALSYKAEVVRILDEVESSLCEAEWNAHRRQSVDASIAFDAGFDTCLTAFRERLGGTQ